LASRKVTSNVASPIVGTGTAAPTVGFVDTETSVVVNSRALEVSTIPAE
jgi:hypothetical protein